MSKLSEFSFDKLLKKGLLKIMIDQLDVNGVVDFLEALLEGIDYFLMFGAEVSGSDQANFMISIFASYGGLQKLDQLQYHVDERIFNRVSSIVDKYFQQLD